MSDGAVRFDMRGAVLVARMAGEIDLSNAEQLGIQVARAAPDDAECVLMDLSEVEHIDSYGIFVLHGLRQRLGERRQKLVLVVPGDAVIRRAIELIGMADVIPIHEDLDDALRSVGQSDS